MSNLQPCRFRGVEREDSCECFNTKDIVHNGWVKLSFCGKCPWAKKPDFWSQTNKLLVHKQKTGEYVPKPKACKPCRSGGVDPRKPLQFVWPYWAGGANGDELRWSIRSVHEWFDGPVKATILGDKPDWWNGHVIHQPRIRPGVPNRAFRDMLTKMWTMATHPEIEDEFVWIMDDVYLVRMTDQAGLMAPRAQVWVPGEHNSWCRRKSNTMKVLREHGYTNWDYATHAPHFVEKRKLKEMYERFDLHNNTLLWEVLYGNIYREAPQDVCPWLVRLWTSQALPDIRRSVGASTVVNNVDGAWCNGLRELLQERCPVPSPGESSYEPVHAKIHRQRQKVKRGVRRGPFKKVKA